MSTNGYERHLFQVLSETLNVSEDLLSLESSRDSVEAWDSLGHIMLMLAVEQRFGCKLSVEQIQSIRTVKDILDCLSKSG